MISSIIHLDYINLLVVLERKEKLVNIKKNTGAQERELSIKNVQKVITENNINNIYMFRKIFTGRHLLVVSRRFSDEKLPTVAGVWMGKDSNETIGVKSEFKDDNPDWCKRACEKIKCK